MSQQSREPSYLEHTAEFYREAALTPSPTLCCTTSPAWKLPGLRIPDSMLQMNYGCGSTVHPRDLDGDSTVVYVGVGAGMEALQFAYFVRRPGGVIAVDRVAEMLDAARRNLEEAARMNDWFDPAFVELREGDALELPVDAEIADVVAQNCLFNIFEEDDLERALQQAHSALRRGGRLLLSDPVCDRPIPERLRRDPRLRAMCLSGALTYDRYLELVSGCGFGTIEVRARRPYRVLDRTRYAIEETLLLESVELAAVKEPVPADGACVFTGRTAIYVGREESLDDGHGHVIARDLPLPVCDKTASRLENLGREDLVVTASTYHSSGGGCC